MSNPNKALVRTLSFAVKFPNMTRTEAGFSPFMFSSVGISFKNKNDRFSIFQTVTKDADGNVTAIEGNHDITEFKEFKYFHGSGMAYITNGTFHDMTALTKCEMPSSIWKDETNVVYSATFSGCTSLKSVILPGYAKCIPGACFAKCSNLESVKVFQGDSLTDSVALKDSAITTIGASAFMGCKKLTLTELPSTVTHICRLAFAGCTRITSLKLTTPTVVALDDANAFHATCTVKVPHSLLSQYQSSPGWRDMTSHLVGY